MPRRRLLVLGAALYTGCFALWTVVPTYAAFAGGFVLWGLSGSLVSGTYEAYVYDHLHARAARRSSAKPHGPTPCATPLTSWPTCNESDEERSHG